MNKEINYIQTCLVCNAKWRYTFDSKIIKKELEEKLGIIRASALACGHQGLFELEKEKKNVE